MTSTSSRVARLMAAALNLALAVTNAVYLPDFYRHTLINGSFTVVYICAAICTAGVLSRADNTAAWGTTLYIGAMSLIDVPVRNTIGYPFIPDFVGKWGLIDLIQIFSGAVLVALAGKVVISRYGAVPALGTVGYLLLQGTYVALLPASVHGAPPLAVTQTFVAAFSLFGAGLVLAGGIGTWITTFFIGAFTTAEHLHDIVAGTSAMLGSPKPWWQITTLANALAGILLGCIACRIILLLWRRSPAEPTNDVQDTRCVYVDELIAMRNCQARHQR